MVDILSMVDLTSISAILAAIGVFVGVVFAILQLRDLVRTRQTDLVMRLYSTFGSREFLEAYPKVVGVKFKDFKDFEAKYGPPPYIRFLETPSFLAYEMHNRFFEGVGVLLRRKLIDIKLVDDLFSWDIKDIWERMKPLVEGVRKTYNFPQYCEWFEYLYNELQKREQQLATIQ